MDRLVLEIAGLLQRQPTAAKTAHPLILVAGPEGCGSSRVSVPAMSGSSFDGVAGAFLAAVEGKPGDEIPDSAGAAGGRGLLLPVTGAGLKEPPAPDAVLLPPKASPNGWRSRPLTACYAIGDSATRARLRLGVASCPRLSLPGGVEEAAGLLRRIFAAEESRLALAAAADGLAEERAAVMEEVEAAALKLEAFMEARRTFGRAFLRDSGGLASEALSLVGAPLAETASQMDLLIDASTGRMMDAAEEMLKAVEDQEGLYRFATLELSRESRTRLSALLNAVRELLGGLERSASEALEGVRRHYGKLSRATGEDAGAPPVEGFLAPGGLSEEMPEVEVTVPDRLLVALRDASRRDPATSLRQRTDACGEMLGEYRSFAQSRGRLLRDGFLAVAEHLRSVAAEYLEELSLGAERALARSAEEASAEARRLEKLVRGADSRTAALDALLKRARAQLLAAGVDPGTEEPS